MNCTNSQIFAHKYLCDIRNVNFVNCKSKLFVSRYNRFNVSNLFDEIRFALFANFELWIFYTRFLFNIEFFWNDQKFFVCFATEISKLMCAYFFFKIWKIVVIAIFASIFWNFEIWKNIVIVIFAFEIIHFDFNQFALKIWKSFSWMTQKNIIWWFHCLLFSISKVWFRTIHNSRFDDWQLIEWQKNRIWITFYFFIFLFSISKSMNRSKKMIKREKRHMILLR